MQQQEALDILKMGHSSFVTGSAGSGKTYLLNRFIDWLVACKIPYAVTAATGIAATHLGGQTIHSWSGLGIKKKLSEADLDLLEQKKQLYNRWNETAVLIIDEISMLSAEQLDTISTIGKALRRSSKPFGGMTVVFSGDFFQLPPVVRGGETASLFAYGAESWKEMRPVICYLETRHRHKEDDVFANILNNIRDGGGDVRQALLCRHTSLSSIPEHITRLYTHNRDVDFENEEKLSALSGKEKTYEMNTKGSRHLVETLKRGCLAPETLRLKVGAEVMFVKNDPRHLYVNGTRGVIVDIKGAYPTVKMRNGRKVSVEPAEWRIEEGGSVKARVMQVPLRLAWAITVHKSQGLTLDEAYMELSGAFVPGQGYVALSRVCTLEGLYLGALNDMALTVDASVRGTDMDFRARSRGAEARLAKLSVKERTKRHKAFVKQYKGTYVGEASPREDADTLAQKRVASHHKTRALLKERKGVKTIAKERGLSEETILNHIEQLLAEDVVLDLSHLKLVEDQALLRDVCCVAEKNGWEKLAPLRSHVRDTTGKEPHYSILRRMRIYETWRKKLTR